MTSVRESGEQRAGGVREALPLPRVAHYQQSFTAEAQRTSGESQLTHTHPPTYCNACINTSLKHASILVPWIIRYVDKYSTSLQYKTHVGPPSHED